MLPKKHKSGSQKRNEKKRVDKLIKSQQGSMNRFVLRSNTAATNSEQLYITNVQEQPDHAENVSDENHADVDAKLFLYVFCAL